MTLKINYTTIFGNFLKLYVYEELIGVKAESL